jgi:hypothetical protein
LVTRALPLILSAIAASARKAAEILERAVELDPGDAVAVALLSFPNSNWSGVTQRQHRGLLWTPRCTCRSGQSCWTAATRRRWSRVAV